jgi:hypothetical protein
VILSCLFAKKKKNKSLDFCGHYFSSDKASTVGTSSLDVKPFEVTDNLAKQFVADFPWFH